MKRYYFKTNSFAAPFFSDTDEGVIEAPSAEEAMDKLVRDYKHPCGLYAAVVYDSYEAYYDKEKPLVRYLSNKAVFLEKRPEHTYTYYSDDPHEIEINGVKYHLDDPYGGKVV